MEDMSNNVVICSIADSLSVQALVSILRGYEVDLCQHRSSDSGFALPLPDLVIRVAPSTHSCPSERDCVLVRNSTPVLFISQEWLESEDAARAAGISGYVGPQCTAAQILEAVRTVIEGGFFYHPGRKGRQIIGQLSPRQVEVMRLIGFGYTDQEIAAKLSIGETTVRHHLRVLHLKLGTDRRGEIAAIAALGGLCNPWQVSCQRILPQQFLFAKAERFVA
ncbi:MAG: LuxR C-terminal-related transcriptional regulator [Armatimonadota bacterium]